MPDRTLTYAAALLIDWFAAGTGRAYTLDAVIDGDTPVFVASSDAGKLAVAIAVLWEPENDQVAEDARLAMQERLDAGSVRGPYLVWVPPRGFVPAEEPGASEFVMRALAPAKVREVRLHEDTGIAEVIVPDFQLSLAIGKEGQNARLAARLTGWRVDIKSESQLAEEESGAGYAEGEWVEGSDGTLMWQPAEGGEAISAAEAGYATLGGDAPPVDAPAAVAPPAGASEAEIEEKPEVAEEEEAKQQESTPASVDGAEET